MVQDAAAYQKLLELLDRLEAISGIQKGLESLRRREGRPLEEAIEELREKYKTPTHG